MKTAAVHPFIEDDAITGTEFHAKPASLAAFKVDRDMSHNDASISKYIVARNGLKRKREQRQV